MKLTRDALLLITNALAALAAAAFVRLYGRLQANWLEHGSKLDLRILPRQRRSTITTGWRATSCPPRPSCCVV